jgi:iron complex transport system ATP-binding protein
MSEAVNFKGLGFFYRHGNPVFQGYSAEVEKGSIFAVLGPNGCGKSTLLKLILGLLEPTEGIMEVRGRAALVPQLFHTVFAFTVLDMVLMGRARKIGLFSNPSRNDVKAALEALDRVGMAGLARRSFHELSGGQRQLVILARALVAEAEIMIMDEPTSALDLKNQSLVLEWIIKLTKDDGLTVIFTTHHPHHALAIAERTLLMLSDVDYICGVPSEVLTEMNLEGLYGVVIKKIDFEHEGCELATLVPVLAGIHRPINAGKFPLDK